ncbi:MAG: CesD/SycD/LcrH family type III secretion system chaperone, partial [Planctomycetota bacterium]
YSPACLHDAGNPVPPLRSAECHLAVGDVETAEACLHVCLEWCGDSGQYSGVRDRANLLLETVNRKKGG